MLLSSLAMTLIFTGRSLAATCYGGQGNHSDIDVAWDLRDAICGHDACAASDADRGDNHYCELSFPYNAGQAVVMQRNDPSGNYPNCYAAYQDIITQCLTDTQSSFTDSDPNGSWAIGNEWYWITMNDTVSTQGDAPAQEDVLVDTSGNDELETLEGPTQFCQGLSPGGGSNCINIAAGCRIQVPLDNTVPTVDCSAIPADP